MSLKDSEASSGHLGKILHADLLWLLASRAFSGSPSSSQELISLSEGCGTFIYAAACRGALPSAREPLRLCPSLREDPAALPRKTIYISVVGISHQILS